MVTKLVLHFSLYQLHHDLDALDGHRSSSSVPPGCLVKDGGHIRPGQLSTSRKRFAGGSFDAYLCRWVHGKDAHRW